MADSPDLSIIIVSYNTRDLILACIESIQQHTGDLVVEIIVVDNASHDGSPAAIRDQYPAVRVIANTTNAYFSAANNQGLRAARGDYALVLNPDTVVRGQTLTQLIDYLRAHEYVGAATTTMFFPDGALQRNGSCNVTFNYLIFQYTFFGKLFPDRTRRLNDHLWYAEWDRTSEREIGVLPGSAIIARRAIWLAVGGFNESMPLYFSDDYFSICVRRLSDPPLTTVYIPSHGITHYENASTRQVSRRALNRYFRDLLAYTWLVFGRPAQIVLTVLLLPTWAAQSVKSR